MENTSPDPKTNNKKSHVNDVPAKINIDAEARALMQSWIDKKDNLKKLSELKLSNIFSFAKKIKNKSGPKLEWKKVIYQFFSDVKAFLSSVLGQNNLSGVSALNKKSTLWFSHLFGGAFFSIFLIILMVIGFTLGIYYIVH